MANTRSQEMLVRAATLYYLEGYSQSEVAAAIGVSRSNVSRVLSDARRTGIVTIQINDPFARSNDLEKILIERYGLRECRVAGGSGGDTPLAQIGQLGAAWLSDNLPAKGAIALSWGASVQSVVDAVEVESPHSGIEVLPLVGGLSITDSARDGNVLVRSLANKIGAQHRRLYAPAVVGSAELRAGLMAEDSIRSVLDSAAEARIAIVGVGAVGSGASSAIVESMQLTKQQRDEFENSGAVGDCCTRFFDADGKVVQSVVNERVVALELEQLREIPTVVGVAAGRNKAPGVHAAAQSGLFDVLIIDAELGLELIKLHK
ncbi:sugar-binding transcriptional regulator [Humidisolicoccus flavus]|uniref:sugar-binding transcriptional regulator n=1 Tax=Humidisolicoccus flavus TaxID=3111414 RepID=UPI00324CDEC0